MVNLQSHDEDAHTHIHLPANMNGLCTKRNPSEDKSLASHSALGKGSEKKIRISYGLLPNRGGGGVGEGSKKNILLF